ncbi:MAG TPA: T9SS type A sorting domain-containing protein [Flavobacteriales bacterium]|nr:T9SS type A sorting domain-containing protein [Flavobacteriales bacterium]HPH82709.1 T9SS type A sorting domain-containing protein [Flavobacteriales bacterium]
MKKVVFLLLIFPSVLLAQINQIWHTDRPYSFSFNDSYMRIVNSDIYTHSSIFEGGSWQSAQSITTDGIENWYMEHDQFQACTNCGNAGVESVAIASNGDAYGVGFQPSSPYGGRYVYKTDAGGNLIYAEEYFTSTFSGEFNDVKLSNDETKLFVFGEMYAEAYNTIVPHLFKLNAATGAIENTVMTAPIGWTGVKSLGVDAGDNLYMNSSDLDTLNYSSWDSDFNLRWYRQIPVAGYQGSGQVQTLFYSNGDVLFVTFLNNYNTNDDRRLHLARYTTTGDLIWQTTHLLEDQDIYGYLYRDVALDVNGNVDIFFAKTKFVGTGGGFGGEDFGGKGGETQIRPAIYKFNSAGVYQWNYVFEGNSGVEFSSEYPARMVVDENGYVIGSSFGNSSGYAGISLFIINPQGLLETSLFQNGSIYSAIKGMVYEGNRTFYTHGIGAIEGTFTADRWTLARYHYDYTTGVKAVSNEGFIVFPNPVKNSHTINIKGLKMNDRIEIRDIQGRLIKEISHSGVTIETIDITGISQGIYYVKAGISSQKLIIQ